jgi:hypothetical protein
MGDNFIADTKRPDWLIHIRNEIQRHEGRGVSYNVLVMKLRACYRVPLGQYTPKQWVFGLHNRDVLHPGESEDWKLALAAACGLGPWEDSRPWEDFCASVVGNPEDVLKAYGLDRSGPKFSMKEVQYLLTLDALTIFFVFAQYLFTLDPLTILFVFDPPAIPIARMTAGFNLIRTRMSWGYAHVLYDLFLFENQITLALLKNVVTRCYENWGGVDSTSMFEEIVKANVLKMCGYIFELTGDIPAKFDMAYPQNQLEQCAHIVVCIHRILCGANWQNTSQETKIIIQSATSLKKAGIQIKGVKGVLDKVDFRKGCLFRNGCLFLPIINLYDQTESYFRNLAMYEFMTDYNSLICPFGEYLQLMTSLIKEVGDVKHLIDCGVINNTLGNDNNAFQMWNSLQSDLFLPRYSTRHKNMVSEINKQCKSRLNVLKTEFLQLFCSRPWYAFGLITATIVTLATCIQAYTAVIGSDKMKPLFPPSPKP